MTTLNRFGPGAALWQMSPKGPMQRGIGIPMQGGAPPMGPRPTPQVFPAQGGMMSFGSLAPMQQQMLVPQQLPGWRQQAIGMGQRDPMPRNPGVPFPLVAPLGASAGGGGGNPRPPTTPKPPATTTMQPTYTPIKGREGVQWKGPDGGMFDIYGNVWTPGGHLLAPGGM